MVEDRVQDLNSVTCGVFQIYFYENLFNLNENSKVQNQKWLNKRTIELYFTNFFDNQDTNEATKIISQYNKRHRVKNKL